ncbi:MAG: arginase [Flavobacteriales bacterium]|jgi:arginase|nr:arginase [Flavobacteriales bacterium]
MSELGAGTRGASLGYDALWVASINAGKRDFFNQFPTTSVAVRNDLLFDETDTPQAKYLEGIAEVYENLSQEVQNAFENKEFPILISGAHSVSGGTIKGIADAFPDANIGVVWIDAHADIHSPYTSPSGNVHGMPLATALCLNDNEFQLDDRVIDPKTKEIWDELCGDKPRISPDDLVYFAVRDTEIPEDEIIEDLGIKNFTVEEVRMKGPKKCVNEALESLNHCDILYISFDVDSMDSMISKGTGTPVLNGLTQVVAEKIIYYLFQSQKVACFEMVEINPTLDDKENKMAETAFSILEKIVKM